MLIVQCVQGRNKVNLKDPIPRLKKFLLFSCFITIKTWAHLYGNGSIVLLICSGYDSTHSFSLFATIIPLKAADTTATYCYNSVKVSVV